MLDTRSLRTAPYPEVDHGWWEQLFPVSGHIAARSMVGVWGTYLLFELVYAALRMSTDVKLGQHFLFALIGLGSTWLLYRFLVIFGDNQISRFLMVLLTLPTMIIALGLSYFSQIIAGGPVHETVQSTGTSLSILIDGAIVPYLVLVVWGTIYLALSRDRAMRIAIESGKQLQKVTQESELRALRYQLNPHFVFNALNSVSGLIIDRKSEQAEKLVDDLADYMRVVLNDDDQHMVSVEREIAQQVRYLKIEQVRFPERLKFDVKIEEEIAEWKIPALIVQPLVENAIKYGVTRSTEPVTIKIRAWREDGRLKLSVANTGRMIVGHNDLAGSGTGLDNIRERLALVYGSSAALVTGNSVEGMAIASIALPEKPLMSGLS